MYREVHYYDYPGAPLAQSVFPEIKELVPSPYGGFYQEALNSCGGWIASIIDLMSFITSVDGHNIRPDILKLSTIKLMVSRPELPDWENTESYYGMGWNVYPVGNEANWWHAGGIPGTICFIVRYYTGIAYVALFNSRPFNTSSFIYEFYNAIDHAINAITEWPSYDLFENYPTEYTLLISSTLGGRTSPSTGTYTYPSGTQVQITAISDTGYGFTDWTGDVPSGHENDNPITITMHSYKSIKANFIRQYDLTIASGIGGTTNPSPGTYTYDKGTKVAIEATPDIYYIFNGWSGDISGKTNPITITMDSNKSITANFRLIYPPSNFTGQKVLNRSLSQAEYINALTWQANPNNEDINIVKYRIYQIEDDSQSLLIELGADQFEYWHRRVEKDKQYTYAIVAVNNEDREGKPAYITIQ